jgi:hypothetical protein
LPPLRKPPFVLTLVRSLSVTVVCAPFASCKTNESPLRLTTTPVIFVFWPEAMVACVPAEVLPELLSCASADGASAKASAKVATKVRSVTEDFILVSLSSLSRISVSLRP